MEQIKFAEAEYFEAYYTDQPKKKALFSHFAVVHTLSEINFFAEGFLREISWRNSTKVRGNTPRDFAEKLYEILRTNNGCLPIL